MRIGVISDSHGMTGRLSTVLMRMEADGPLDALLHLGDGYDDLASLGIPLPPVYQVAGNCDHFRTDTLNLITLSGARLMLTHGHNQHVKQGTDELLQFAINENVHAAFYGHTHVQKMEWRNGILLLNPGSAASGDFAILTINRLGALDAQLFG